MHRFFFFSPRQTDVTLSLKDPHYPDHDLGSIFLSVLLAPGDQQEAVILSILINVITPVIGLWLDDIRHKSKSQTMRLI